MKTVTKLISTSLRPLSCRMLLLAAVILLAFAPQSIRAGSQVPFKAGFSTEFESTLDFPFLHVSVTGQGTASHLGKTTAVTTDQLVNLLDGSATATYTLTGANGDTLVLALNLQVTEIPGGVSFAGSYTIAGGTDRFAGATGNGSLAGTAIFLGPNNGIGLFSVEGTISSPGSLKQK
jgi:hypothetical protein